MANSLIPLRSGKVSADRLKNCEKLTLEAFALRNIPKRLTLLKFHHGCYEFDFLWSPKASSSRLFVIFSGDALRKRNNPPVFQRWRWAEYFTGHCLYVSDPALHLSTRLGLGWYSGTRDCDFLKLISVFVDGLSAGLNISPTNVYSYGSSGGGFAALRLMHTLPRANAIVINPQTSICRFEFSSVERYLKVCYGIASREQAQKNFPERLDLTAFPQFLSGRKIMFVQNKLDPHHYDSHYVPLCKAMQVEAMHDPDNPVFSQVHFEHEGGHRKAETAEIFGNLMQRIENGEF